MTSFTSVRSWRNVQTNQLEGMAVAITVVLRIHSLATKAAAGGVALSEAEGEGRSAGGRARRNVAKKDEEEDSP